MDANAGFAPRTSARSSASRCPVPDRPREGRAGRVGAHPARTYSRRSGFDGDVWLGPLAADLPPSAPHGAGPTAPRGRSAAARGCVLARSRFGRYCRFRASPRWAMVRSREPRLREGESGHGAGEVRELRRVASGACAKSGVASCTRRCDGMAVRELSDAQQCERTAEAGPHAAADRHQV